MSLEKLSKEEFTIKDFSLSREVIDKREFTLIKPCTIFHKQLGEAPLYLWVHNDFELSNYILQVSDCLNWLGAECENSLIRYFNENMQPEKAIDTEWYKELAIFVVTIEITEQGEIEIDIKCEDCYFKRDILYILIKEKKIDIMEYWNVDDFGEE